MNRQRTKGYTLVELMIVVVIIGVLTALAIPSITEALRNNALSDAANQVLVAFRHARTSAAQTGLTHRVVVDPSMGGVGIVRVDRGTDNQWTFPGGCDYTKVGYGGVDCGVRVVRFDSPYYVDNKVKIIDMQVGGVDWSAKTLTLCVSPRGRTVDCTTAVPAPIGGFVEIIIDRTTFSGDSAGVARRIIVPPGALPRSGV